MRLVLLAAVASLWATACDQGATAAPPPAPVVQPLQIEAPKPPPPPTYERYEVKSDEDFADKALVVLDELFGLFEQQQAGSGTANCELIATSVENFGQRNATRFAVLTAYGKAHPGAEQLVQKRFEPRMSQLVSKLTTVLSPCMSNQRLLKAFEKLSQEAQGFQQRAR